MIKAPPLPLRDICWAPPGTAFRVLLELAGVRESVTDRVPKPVPLMIHGSAPVPLPVTVAFTFVSLLSADCTSLAAALYLMSAVVSPLPLTVLVIVNVPPVALLESELAPAGAAWIVVVRL